MMAPLPFGHRSGPDFYRRNPWIAADCGWLKPGAACRILGHAAQIIRKSILPDRVWVRRAGAAQAEAVSIALVLPDREEFGVRSAEYPAVADPSVVLA